MGSDDANDVSKALAAIGADSIGYQRFTQAPTRPQLPIPPRPVTVPPQVLPPAHEAAASVPPAAPAPRPDTRPKPAAMPPVPAFRRTLDPALTARRPAPMPPPRPLADGAFAPGRPAGESAMAASSRPAQALPSVPVASIPASPAEVRALEIAAAPHGESLADIFALLAHGPNPAYGAASQSK